MGRPKIQLNYGLIEDLSNIQCTQQEIATILGCSVDTLQRDDKFCGLYKNGLENGKISLRRAQFKSALGGNTTMQIWLGRQYLKQSEYKDENGDITSNPIINLNITDNSNLEKKMYEAK